MIKLREFWLDETGPEMVEWAVVTVILLAATVLGVIAIRDTLIDMFRATFNKLEEAPPSSFP